MTMTEGPLVWEFYPACDLTALVPPLTSGQQTQVIAQAVEWLWVRSARRYGTRSAVYRPQSRGRGRPGWPYVGLQPYGSSPLALMEVAVDDDWSIESDQVLKLPPPVATIEAVEINGVAVDPTLYRREGDYLVRQDGGMWPRTQNMIAALGLLDTWCVRYTRGYPPSAYGQWATGKLICYFATQASQGKPCELPLNTTSVSRAGVSIQRDPKKGAPTSPVPEVDRWLTLVNPEGLQSEPKVWSPDVDRNRRPFAGSYEGTTPPQGVWTAGAVTSATVLVLGPTDPVPPGTPIGTVIFREE